MCGDLMEHTHRGLRKINGGLQVAHLVMVRPEDDPATETVTQVDHGRTAAESDHVGERRRYG